MTPSIIHLTKTAAQNEVALSYRNGSSFCEKYNFNYLVMTVSDVNTVTIATGAVILLCCDNNQ